MSKYTYSEDCYSDLHKGARGFRPGQAGYEAWDAMTPDEKQVRWDQLVEELELSERDREMSESNAVREFEARVTEVIDSGAKDRETAIRWIFEAEDDLYVFGDPDYFCYNYGLPYGYFKKAA